MSLQLKQLVYRVVICSFAIAVLNLVVGWIFGSLYTAEERMYDWNLLSLQTSIFSYLELILCFISAAIIAKKIPDLSYWKIVFWLLVTVVLVYHLLYVYEVTDYYLIQDKPAPTENALEGLLNLFSTEPTAPSYDPINHLINWNLISVNPTPKITIAGVVNFLFGSTVLRVFWISAIVFLIVRKLRGEKKVIKENSLLDQ